jgi:hypothetical protein
MATRSLHSLRTTLLVGKRNIPLEVVHRRLNSPSFGPRYGLSGIHRPLHTALWPPLVFAQLLIVLWAYKVGSKQCGLKYAAVLDVDSLPEQVNLSALYPARRPERKYQ